MSIRRIPDRYLKDTIHIYRESEVVDSVGDYDVSQALAYAELKANLQPQTSEVDFNIQGKIHRQTHAAYLNKVENEIVREIRPGDVVLCQDSGLTFIALGVQEWEAANRNITDSHHIKLILKTMTGKFTGLTRFKTVTVKAKIS